MNYVIVLLVGYLLGSIPTSVIVSKIALKDDVRKHGSGNPGASNMMRSFGFKYAAIVLVGDMLKGLLAALVGQWLLGQSGLYYGTLAAVVGHNWPVFLKFKGGKGVATTLGGMLAIVPLWTACACLLFILTLLLTRYFSVASLVALGFLWVMILVFYMSNTTLFFFTTLLVLLSVYRHRTNIDRLMQGTEPKLKH